MRGPVGLPAFLWLDGSEGRTFRRVYVISRTPKRYRIRCIDDQPVRLAGRRRYLNPGETTLVPTAAINFAVGHRRVTPHPSLP